MNVENNITKKPRKKIGGLLILVCIGMILRPIFLLLEIHNTMICFQKEVWLNLTTQGTEIYHPLWGPVIIFELITTSSLLIFSLILMFLFFKKDARLPKCIIIFFIVHIIILVLKEILLSFILPASLDTSTYLGEIVSATLVYGIWGAYFHKSERVKNTFVN